MLRFAPAHSQSTPTGRNSGEPCCCWCPIKRRCGRRTNLSITTHAIKCRAFRPGASCPTGRHRLDTESSAADANGNKGAVCWSEQPCKLHGAPHHSLQGRQERAAEGAHPCAAKSVLLGTVSAAARVPFSPADGSGWPAAVSSCRLSIRSAVHLVNSRSICDC